MEALGSENRKDWSSDKQEMVYTNKKIALEGILESINFLPRKIFIYFSDLLIFISSLFIIFPILLSC
jgi:hypothetical protein